MKELYISPETEIITFAPVEQLANNYGFNYDTWGNATDLGFGTSTGTSVVGDYYGGVDPEDQEQL